MDDLCNLFDKKLNLKNKGSECSKEGFKYEKQIYNIVSKCKNKNNNEIFNKQSINNLGGSNSKNDIICIWNNLEIPIEIKKMKAPDYMQLTLYYDNNKYIPTKNNKISNKSKEIFNDLLKDKQIFNNKIPPFYNKKITHEEWLEFKKKSTDFNDMYFDCPDDTIKKLYSNKGCYYIQISDKGLYHLGEDICNFNVPEFLCEQEIRIRTKIHSKKTSKGYCQLSIMMSCKPKYIMQLKPSLYSLDKINILPSNLIYSN